MAARRAGARPAAAPVRPGRSARSECASVFVYPWRAHGFPPLPVPPRLELHGNALILSFGGRARFSAGNVLVPPPEWWRTIPWSSRVRQWYHGAGRVAVEVTASRVSHSYSLSIPGAVTMLHDRNKTSHPKVPSSQQRNKKPICQSALLSMVRLLNVNVPHVKEEKNKSETP